MPPSSCRATSHATAPTSSSAWSRRPGSRPTPFIVPRYREDATPNLILARRPIWRLADELAGDCGFGLVLAAHPEQSASHPGRRHQPGRRHRRDGPATRGRIVTGDVAQEPRLRRSPRNPPGPSASGRNPHRGALPGRCSRRILRLSSRPSVRRHLAADRRAGPRGISCYGDHEQVWPIPAPAPGATCIPARARRAR